MNAEPSQPEPGVESGGSEGVGHPADGSLRAKIGKVAVVSGVALLVGELFTLAQVIALARLLSPTEVGLFTAGTVLTVLLGDVAEGGLKAAMIQDRRPVEETAGTTFWATLAAGALLSLVALAAAPLIGWIFKSDTVTLVAAASSGGLLLLSLRNVPEAILQRQFSARRGLVGPAMSFTFGAVAVTFALLGWGVWSMVVGAYASYLVAVVFVWLMCDWRPRRAHFSFTVWRELARFGFPIVVMVFGGRIKMMIEAVIVGRILGPAGLGQYRYALRIGDIPTRGIIQVGGISLFPAFARIAGDKERLRAAFVLALQWVVIAAAPVAALMIALGLPAVVVVLGEPWRPAGLLVVAMGGVAVGNAILSVAQEAIKGAGRTSLLHWCTAVGVGGGVIFVLALIGPLGLFGVGLALSITSVLVGLMATCFVTSTIKVPVRSVLRVLGPPILAAATACAAMMYLDRYVLHSDLHPPVVAIGLLIAEALALLVVYLGVLFLVAPSTVRQMIEVVLRLVRRKIVRSEGKSA